MATSLSPTKLAYFDDMWKMEATSIFLSLMVEGDRLAVIVDCTILYPQGGGQPADHGWITDFNEQLRFHVEDVRLKEGLVYHYGFFETHDSDSIYEFSSGQEVILKVDKVRREINARLHSAGHLLDISMHNLGLTSLEPTKGHHFPEGPFVEYKGTVPAAELEGKRVALEEDANRLVAAGGAVKAVIVSYDEAAAICGGKLPDYISKESSPRIVILGENSGCPCGGTHVADISLIGSVKVSRMKVKKNITKVFYSLVS